MENKKLSGKFNNFAKRHEEALINTGATLGGAAIGVGIIASGIMTPLLACGVIVTNFVATYIAACILENVEAKERAEAAKKSGMKLLPAPVKTTAEYEKFTNIPTMNK